MHGAHYALVAGHLGFNKAYERLREGVTWPEMYIELKVYVRSCDSCQGIRPQIRNALVC
jgi:Integrase zinc binding domain